MRTFLGFKQSLELYKIENLREKTKRKTDFISTQFLPQLSRNTLFFLVLGHILKRIKFFFTNFQSWLIKNVSFLISDSLKVLIFHSNFVGYIRNSS